MDNFFNSLAKELNDINTNMAGDSSAEFSGWINTGSMILNALLSGTIHGGIPNNKIVGIAGEEATGKSFYVLSVAKNFLDSNPTGGVLYFDTESAITKEMMTSRGIDASRVIVSEPNTVEEFRNKAVDAIDKYMMHKNRPPMLMVLDSLGQLSTSKEVGDITAGKDTRDMTRAQVIKAAFRVLTLKLARARVPMIVTNHTYDVIGSNYPQKEMGGGSGLKYAASIILYLSKAKDQDQTTKELYGNIITVMNEKSRFTRPGHKVKTQLSFDKGLNPYYGLLDIAEKYNIFKKVSTRYELPDGSTAFGKSINNNPEKYYTEEVLKLIDDACGKEFKFGSDEQPQEDETEETESVE